jgi:predicted dehydrogenase
MDKIKIGIIGLGMAWERLHAPAFAKHGDKFDIVAVCDKNMDKAREVAAWLNLPPESAYGDYHHLLARPDVEAVDTMVPIQENYECAAAVIRKGKHLLAEKPFAASPEEARYLIKLKNRMGVHVMVAENFRYDEENKLIKQLINDHRIGNPIYFIDNNVTEFQKEMVGDGFARVEWRQHPPFEGGVFLDSGVHHVARQRFLFGDVLHVFASGRPSEADFAPYSCINALLTFKQNAEFDHTNIIRSTTVAGHYCFHMTGRETQAPLVGLRIFGTNGEIYLEERSSGYVNVSYKDGCHEAIPYTPGQGYFHELDNFHGVVKRNENIISTPEKALGDIEVIFAMLKSAAGEKTVKVSDTLIKSIKRSKAS